MKQRIFSHFHDYLIQYISHQYQDLLYYNSSQYILSTYNSKHKNNNNVVLAMTMPYSGQGWRHSALSFGSCTMPSTLTTILTVIANTTLLYKYCIVCFVHVSMSLPLLILLWNKYWWIISILFFSRYYGFLHRHDITEILSKVALYTTTPLPRIILALL